MPSDPDRMADKPKMNMMTPAEKVSSSHPDFSCSLPMTGAMTELPRFAETVVEESGNTEELVGCNR